MLTMTLTMILLTVCRGEVSHAMSQVILVLTMLWFIALWLCEKKINCGYVGEKSSCLKKNLKMWEGQN